jgi:hypothetical protein
MSIKSLNLDKPVKANFVQRLNKAIHACRVASEATNSKTDKMLRTYASGFYLKKDTIDEHAINMIDRAVSILLPYLVGGNPKIWIEPRYNLDYKPFAHTFEQALNHFIKSIKLATRTLEPAVLNSLFSMGIVKTGTKKAGTLDVHGYLSDYGMPFCEVVDRTRYVFDIAAKDREQYEFEGDSYYVSTVEAKEQFKKYADKITPDFKLYGEKSPQDVTNPNDVSFSELHDYSEFYDIWLPKERTVITIMPGYKNFNKILRTVQYDGPESGPYDVLFYKSFPESTIPIPPIFSLMELDTAINTLFSKARNQAERLKKIGVFENGSEKDAKVAMDAKDGDMVGLSNTNGTKEMTLGGVVPEVYQFLSFSMNQFSEQGGNLNTAGGRSSGADTLGQEEMLMSNAGRSLNMMSRKVHQFSASIAEKIAHEMWTNPTLQISTIKDVAGLMKLPVMYDQTQQAGDFLDYEFDIDMFSMQKLTPEQRYQKVCRYSVS